MSVTLDQARNLYKLLKERKRWTRGVFARDKQGVSVDEYSKDACSWCITGAIRKSSAWMATTPISNKVRKMYPGRLNPLQSDIAAFNDHGDTTHEDVLKVIKSVIKDLRA